MRLKRWAGLGIAALALALALGLVPGGRFALARAQAQVRVSGPSCGLGPPPGSPGFAKAVAGREAEARAHGYEVVCDADLARYDIPWKLRPLAEARPAFEPVDLAHTPFAGFEDMGNQVETIVGKRARLYRRFRLPDGHTLVLSEEDMSADGSHMQRDPKDEPERINGMPGRLTILQTPSGKAISILDWLEGRRYYQLWTDANVGRSGPLHDRLFALAAALPASKPACRHEPPYHPPRTGPDGMPVWENTQAGVDAVGKTCLD